MTVFVCLIFAVTRTLDFVDSHFLKKSTPEGQLHSLFQPATIALTHTSLKLQVTLLSLMCAYLVHKLKEEHIICQRLGGYFSCVLSRRRP